MKHKIEVTVYVSHLDPWQKDNQSDPDWRVCITSWSITDSDRNIIIGKQMVSVDAPDMRTFDSREKQIEILKEMIQKKRAETYKEVTEMEEKIQNLLALGH